MGISRLLLWLAAFFLLTVVSINCSLAQSVANRVNSSQLLARLSSEDATPTRPRATPRPTFTPTPSFTDTPTPSPTPTITPIPTETPTSPPTPTPVPTDTPVPTNTPVPTQPPPPPPPTDTPAPVPTPAPDYPFKIREQGDRTWQKTNAPILSNIFAVTDGNGTPIGGLFIMGEHSSGKTFKSPATTWQYDACAGTGGYGKCGNVKFEPPGGFQDGTWNVYVVDGGGAQLSEKVPLSYSSDPNQWYWDFIWWAR